MDVLVYLDPSPRGEWALAAAARLPPRCRGPLRLVATAEDAAARLAGKSARPTAVLYTPKAVALKSGGIHRCEKSLLYALRESHKESVDTE